MSTREDLEIELARLIKTKNLYLDARDSLATGGTSYTITDGDSTRQLTRASLSSVNKTIDLLERKIATIRQKLASPNLSPKSRITFVRGF